MVKIVSRSVPFLSLSLSLSFFLLPLFSFFLFLSSSLSIKDVAKTKLYFVRASSYFFGIYLQDSYFLFVIRVTSSQSNGNCGKYVFKILGQAEKWGDYDVA